MSSIFAAVIALFLSDSTVDQAKMHQRPAGLIVADQLENAHPQSALDCRVPVPSKRARIIRLGAREGGRISNIAIGGQEDAAYVATVKVEQGKERLFVIASNAAPTIWQFEGKTSRVEALVLSGRSKRNGGPTRVTGAIGVARRKVWFVDNDCFGDFGETDDAEQFENHAASKLVAKYLGRPADANFAQYRFEGLAIPSMQPFEITAIAPSKFQIPPTYDTANLWLKFIRSFNGGLASFRPKQIVSFTPAEEFITYPYGAGLIQLTLSGGIERNTVGGFSGYRILKPIQMPPGLYGGYAEQFSLAEGVPLPTGNIGHSKIYLEPDGECAQGCNNRKR